MTAAETFDGYLKEKQYEEAYRWVMEKLIWHPDSTEFRGMASYLYSLTGYEKLALEITSLVFTEDHRNVWALAVKLKYTRLSEIEKSFEENYENKPFRLDIDWLYRFAWAEDDESKTKLVFCLVHFGDTRQKAWLSENWFASPLPKVETEMVRTQSQMNLPIGIKAKFPPRRKTG
jgi:hypothetical protein